MKERFHQFIVKIKESLPITFSQLIIILMVIYIGSIVMGYLPKDQRIDIATLLVVTFSTLIILSIQRPTLFSKLLARIEEIQIGEFKAKLRRVEEVQKEQQKVIDSQQETINQLVIYSLGYHPYLFLWRIGKERYLEYQKNNDGFKRCLYVLLDNGYIKPKNLEDFLRFDNSDCFKDKENMANRIEPTPAGWFLLDLRGKP